MRTEAARLRFKRGETAGRIGVAPVVARDRDGAGRQGLPGALSGTGELPGRVRLLHGRQTETVDPPAGFAAQFASLGYGPDIIPLFEAQYRRDVTQRRLQQATAQAALPDLSHQTRNEAEAERDRMQGVHQTHAAEYELLWPGDHPAPNFRGEAARKQTIQRLPSPRDPAFRRKLHILQAGKEGPLRQQILRKHPDVVAAYQEWQAQAEVRQDMQNARDLAQTNRLYCNPNLIPGVRNNWYLFLGEPLRDIVVGLTTLLGRGNTMMMEEAEEHLAGQIALLAQSEDKRMLRDTYIRLHTQWPHIGVLHEGGGIETAAGALAYYSALEKRFHLDTT